MFCECAVNKCVQIAVIISDVCMKVGSSKCFYNADVKLLSVDVNLVDKTSNQ